MAGKASLVLPFNSQAVNKAAARNGKPTEYSIEGVRGLRLRVFPATDGTTPVAVYAYRYTLGRGERREHRRFKIGRRDAVSLHEARRRTDDLRREVETGIDVARVADARREAMTFRELAERCLTENTSTKDSTRRVYREALEADVLGTIGNKAAQDVTADDVAAITRRIAERGAKVQADRTRTAIAAVFKWGRAERLVSNTPTAGLMKHGPKVARDRVLSDDELKTFWQALHSDDAPVSTATRRIIVLALLTAQRRTEVAGAEIAELSLAGERPVWVIRGDRNIRGKLVRGRTKSGREQTVQLSTQAAAEFKAALADIAGLETIAHVFPNAISIEDDKKADEASRSARALHIHGESVSKAMRRLRSTIMEAASETGQDCSLDDITVHDLRRTMATYLGNQGVHPVALETVLGHAGEGVTRKHYNHAAMTEQARHAMQLWADHIWRVTGQAQAITTLDKVIGLRA